MGAPDFSQTWLNVSSKPLTLVSWSCTEDAVLGTVITSPGQTLKGGTGEDSLSWSQTASFIASGQTDGSIVWNTPNGTKVGVNIHVPLQIGPFGTAPYYQMKTGDDDWVGNFTSETKTFDKERTGVNITVRPTAGHSNLYLKIEVTD
jgi:hypothetical protein